jgi:hypothetical protein
MQSGCCGAHNLRAFRTNKPGHWRRRIGEAVCLDFPAGSTRISGVDVSQVVDGVDQRGSMALSPISFWMIFASGVLHRAGTAATSCTDGRAPALIPGKVQAK